MGLAGCRRLTVPLRSRTLSPKRGPSFLGARGEGRQQRAGQAGKASTPRVGRVKGVSSPRGPAAGVRARLPPPFGHRLRSRSLGPCPEDPGPGRAGDLPPAPGSRTGGRLLKGAEFERPGGVGRAGGALFTMKRPCFQRCLEKYILGRVPAPREIRSRLQTSTLALGRSCTFLFKGTKNTDPWDTCHRSGYRLGRSPAFFVRCAASLRPHAFLGVSTTSQRRSSHVPHPCPRVKPSSRPFLGADARLSPSLPGPQGLKRAERGLRELSYAGNI